MLCVSLLLVLAVNAVDLDIVSLPLTNDVKVVLTPAGRGQLKRDGNVSQIRIDIDRITPATSLAPALSTYVVWAVFQRYSDGSYLRIRQQKVSVRPIHLCKEGNLC